MKRLLAALQAPTAIRLFWDALALVGLALIGVGLWLIYPPVALIVVGALLLVGAVYGARTWSGGPGDGQ